MTIANGELHHRSVNGVLKHCVSIKEGREILRDIHEGDCGHHAGSKSLVAKAFRHGFYWLAAHADVEDLSGDLTWLGLSKGPKIKRPTFWWQSTNSQSGLRQSQLVSVMRQQQFNSSKR